MSHNPNISATGSQYNKLNDLIIPRQDSALLQKILVKNQIPVKNTQNPLQTPENAKISNSKPRLVDLCPEDKAKIGELVKKVTEHKTE